MAAMREKRMPLRPRTAMRLAMMFGLVENLVL